MRAFSGPVGRVLEQLMGIAELYAEDVAPDGDETIGTLANAYLTYTVKYRTPGSRQPNPEETLVGAEALRQEWAILERPAVLVALGGVARAALAPASFGKIQPGESVEIAPGVYVWVMFHPQYGLRHPEARPLIESHWEVLGQCLRSMR